MPEIVKSPDRALNRQESVNLMDLDEVKLEEIRLKNIRRRFLLSGDARGVAQIEDELRNLPSMKLALEVKNLNDQLAGIETELRQCKNEEAALQEIRKQRQVELAEAIKEHEAKHLAVSKIDASLYQCDNKRQTLLQDRRDAKTKLDEVMKNAEQL